LTESHWVFGSTFYLLGTTPNCCGTNRGPTRGY